MDRSTPIKLVAKSYTRDDLAQLRPTETERTVFANIRSVTRAEWSAAGQQGLRPEWQATMFAPDYRGESIVIIGEARYAVYRTYIRQDEQIELYLEMQAGVTNTEGADVEND